MENDVPPPPGPSLAQQLADMLVDGYKLFENPPQSVRASISRLKMKTGYRSREYTTRPKGDGCEVWRLK